MKKLLIMDTDVMAQELKSDMKAISDKVLESTPESIFPVWKKDKDRLEGRKVPRTRKDGNTRAGKPGRSRNTSKYKDAVGEHVKEVVKSYAPKGEVQEAIKETLSELEPVNVFLEAVIRNRGNATEAMLELQPQLTRQQANSKATLWMKKVKGSEIYTQFMGKTYRNIDELLDCHIPQVKLSMTKEILDRFHGKVKDTKTVDINLNQEPISADQKKRIAERILKEEIVVEAESVDDSESNPEEDVQ